MVWLAKFGDEGLRRPINVLEEIMPRQEELHQTQPFKVVGVSELEKVGDVGNRKRMVEGGGSNNDSSRSHGGNKNL